MKNEKEYKNEKRGIYKNWISKGKHVGLKLDLQLNELTKFGCTVIYQEKVSQYYSYF